ncbi:MAG: hypothetical protein V3U89_08610 [Methylophilaceae bacterium]
MNKDSFYLEVAYGLAGCQLVERELKLYITAALELVKECVGSTVCFKMSGEDYAKSPLGRLIEIFNKLNNNEGLISKLEMFKKERNFLSHQGITHCLDYNGELFHPDVVEFQSRLGTIREVSEGLCIALSEEANKLIQFDDLTKQTS